MRAAPTVMLLVLWPNLAAADLSLSTSDFAVVVVEADVTYTVKACSTDTQSTSVGVYYDLSAPPNPGTSPEVTKSVVADSTCPEVTLQRTGAPIGLYQSYAVIDPNDTISEFNEGNNVAGPLEVCVGPDVVVKTFDVEIYGASVTYVATVCNEGSMEAKKFRVGFWHNRTTAPPADEMGDIFKGIASLLPGVCEDITLSAGLRPNGSFTAWSRADSGDFVTECRESNNPNGPLDYSLSNPDLDVVSFEAQVSGSGVVYTVEVCNKGTADVGKFYLDIYFDRPKLAPTIGEPGDLVQPVQSLKHAACTELTFQRSNTPKGTYLSYAMADPDDFISEPNEANNLSMGLSVVVGQGNGGSSTENCTDADKDGFGAGAGCVGVPDCNDNDPDTSPGATEKCGDMVDDDCDLTPDDGCPGVDCTDGDGDSFGVGADCVLPDCDDNNKDLYPWAPEKCGDNVDDNCNKIADDGCTGRQCVDQDMDGYGVGKGCPGPQDCDDTEHQVKPGATEVCGDGQDNDCDSVADDGCDTSVDNDNDGDPVGGGSGGQPDCNDKDPKIGPGQQETCGDKIDNDCDGTVDDGCPGVDCKDGDKDGWGVGSACAIEDCDDNDAARHPWATEVCDDKIDNDCDGTVDDGCPGVDCVDNDYDSWGVGKDCAVQDCDDTDGGTSPWVQEICSDGQDNNCDGSIDESCLVCEDADGDGHGIGPKCPSWDCDDADPETYPGAPERCNGVDNDCNETADNDCSGGDEGCSCLAGGPAAARPLPAFPLWLLLGLGLVLAALRRF